jgi:hypothetical protein
MQSTPEGFTSRQRPELPGFQRRMIAAYEAEPGALTYPGCMPEGLAAILEMMIQEKMTEGLCTDIAGLMVIAEGLRGCPLTEQQLQQAAIDAGATLFLTTVHEGLNYELTEAQLLAFGRAIRAKARPHLPPLTDRLLLQAALEVGADRFQATAGDPVQYELTEAKLLTFGRAVAAMLTIELEVA